MVGRLGTLGVIGLSGNISNSELTYASGKKFPVWNTIQDYTPLELRIFGKSRQVGTPSKNHPARVNSIDNLVLKLQPNVSSEGRFLDLSDYVLRSLPSGICDEVTYHNGLWELKRNITESVFNSDTDFILVERYSDHGIIFFRIGNIRGDDTFPDQYPYPYKIDDLYCDKFKVPYSSFPGWDKIGLGNAVLYNRGGTTLYKGIYFGIPLEIYDAGIDTVREYMNGIKVYYELPKTKICPIDLPEIQMYNGQTWFSIDSKLDGYMKGTFKVRKSIDFVPGAIYHYYFGNKSNQDTAKTTIDDLSGKGNALTLNGFNYTNESGYVPGGLKFDGINDFGTPNKNNSYKTAQLSFSSLIPQKDKNTYLFGNFNAVNQGNNREIGMLWGESSTFKGRLVTQGFEKVYDNETLVPVETAALLGTITSSTDEAGRKRIISTVISRETQVPAKLYLGSYYPGGNYSDCILHEFIAYERELSEDEIKRNVKVLQQRNGIETDPLPLTFASGRLFPIWNTLEGNNIARLQVFGETLQEGTPTMESPVPPVNTIDGKLTLSAGNSADGTGEKNSLTFEDITLRSLPSGEADEVCYENGIWKLTRRVKEYVINENSPLILDSKTPQAGIIGYKLGNIIGGDMEYSNERMTENAYSNKFRFIPDYNSGKAPDLSVGDAVVWVRGDSSNVLDKYVYFFIPLEIYNRGINAAKEYLAGTSFSTALPEPVETEITPSGNTTKLYTYPDTTYLYAAGAYCKCQCRVSRSIDFVEGARLHYFFGDKNNNDSDRDKVKNLSDTRYDLSLQNFAFTTKSGYTNQGIQTDGIDDHIQTTLDFVPRSLFISCSVPPVDEDKRTSYATIMARENITDLFNRTSLFNYKEYGYNRIRSNAEKNYVDGILSPSDTVAPFNQMITYALIMSDFRRTDWYFNLSGIIADSGIGIQWPAKAEICEVLCYDRELSENEIALNTKALQQRNGIDITNYKL